MIAIGTYPRGCPPMQVHIVFAKNHDALLSHDFYCHLFIIFCGRSLNNGTQSFSNSSLLTDDLPHIFGCYPKMDDRALFVFCFCDYDTVRVVYK